MPNRNAKTEQLTVDGITVADRSASGARDGLGTFGRYQLLALLGEGGMGAVYRAYDPQLDREVALKLVTRPKGAEAGDGWTHQRRERLLREARLAARVRHPSIVAVYETGEIDGRVYLAQELIDGATLRDLLEATIVMPAAEAIAITRGLAEALGAVHAAGLIHRDVKPENIMLHTDGRVMLTDFGAARESGVAGKNETGLYIGTPEYSSPEQCVSDDLDGRSDLYSLGVVLFEMLSGTVPHVGESPVELLGKIMSTEAPRLGALLPSVSPSVDATVARLLARKRLDRYSDVAELIGDLDAVAGRRTPTTQRRRADRPAATRPATTRRQRFAGRGRRIARRGLTALLIGIVTAATAAAGGAWAWWSGATEARAEAHLPQPPARDAVVVDAAGGADASLIGTALRRKFAGIALDAGLGDDAAPIAVTVREFPHTNNVVVELTRDGRRIGRVAYTDTHDMVASVVRDVLGWVENELTRITPSAPSGAGAGAGAGAPVLPVDLDSPDAGSDATAHPVDCPGCDDHGSDADGTHSQPDTGRVPPA